MQALPFVLPAAAAGLAYLDGRLALSHDLPVVSSLIRAQISGYNGERTATISLFYTLEERAKSADRHRPFIIYGGETWSYAAAYENTLKYGAWLTSKGVRSGDVVAVDFLNSDTFIWCWFGLWSVGACPAFINTNLKGEPLIHCIRTCGAGLVLADEHSADNFSADVMKEHGFSAMPSEEGPSREGKQARYGFENDERHLPVAKNRSKTASSESPPGPRKLEIIFFDKRLESCILRLHPTRLPNSARTRQQSHDMAMLIYTSGTTGLPKPAIMSWHKARVGALFTGGWMSVKKSDVMYTAMPLYHSAASVLGVGTMLLAGGAISISQKFSHKHFWPEVRASKATIIQYVGETCRYLLAAPPSPLDKQHHLRAAFGNGLRPDVWQPFKDRFGINTIYEFYSATEAPAALFNCSTNAFSAGAFARFGSLGSLIMKYMGILAIRMDPADPLTPLRDPSTGLCLLAAANEPGELVFALDAANIARKFQGYYGNQKATHSKILRDVRRKGDAYFRSGDLVRCDADGRWFFVDRLGDTFRWKAENVSTAEVADVLGRHPAVQEANVYGVQVPHHDGRAGCAAVVFKDIPVESSHAVPVPPQHVLASVAQHLRKELPAFAVPLWLRVTRAMHTTGTNKQQKHLVQKDGIDVAVVEAEGDALFWLQGKDEDARYVRFTQRELERVKAGSVKL